MFPDWAEHYVQQAIDEWHLIKPDEVSLQQVYVLPQATLRPFPRPREGDEPPIDKPELISSQNEGQIEDSPSLVTLAEALHQSPYLVLVGEPGIGKSTTLQYLALVYACEALRRTTRTPIQEYCSLNIDFEKIARIPFLLNLHEWSSFFQKHDDTILERIFATIARSWGADTDVNSIIATRDSGQLLVLLDGLDEVESQQEVVRREILNFRRRAPKCRIVVATRPANYTPLGPPFRDYVLQLLEPKNFLRRWLAARRKKHIDDEALWEEIELAWQIIQGTPALKALAKTPLTLKMLAEIVGDAGAPQLEKIHTRAELYERYITKVLWKRAQRRGATDEEKAWALILLEAWAWARHTQNKSTEKELRRVWERTSWESEDRKLQPLLPKKDEKTWIRARRLVREQIGLLSAQRVGDDNVWLFTHSTWQEYFVARYLQKCWKKNSKETWKFLRPRLHAQKWQEPLLLLSSFLEDASVLVQKVYEAHSDFEVELNRDFILAAKMIKEGAWATAVETKIRSKLIYLVKRWRKFIVSGCSKSKQDLFIQDRDRNVICLLFRLSPIKKRFFRPNTDALIHIIQSLNPRDDFLREIEQIVTQLLDDECAFARISALKLLHEINPEKTASLSFNQFWNEHATENKIELLKILGETRRIEFTPLYLRLLDNSNNEIRKACIHNLGQLEERAIPILKRFILDINNPYDARLSAIEALSTIELPETLPLIKELIAFENDENIREFTLNALRSFHIREVTDEIEFRLRNDESSFVRIAALEALKRAKNARISAEKFVLALDDEDPEVREAAMSAMSTLSRQGYVEASVLERLLTHEDAGVRAWAAEEVGRLHLENKQDMLLNLLQNDPEEEVRSAAARGLGLLNSTSVKPILMEVTQNPLESAEVRFAAIEALASLGISNDEEAILWQLFEQEQNRDMQIAIVKTIAKLQTPGILDRLRTLLAQCTDQTLLAVVIEALGEQQDFLIEKRLLQIFRSDNTPRAIKLSTARALSRLGTRKSISALLEAIVYPEIGKEIQNLLEKLPINQAMPVFLRAACHPQKIIRRFVIVQLQQWAQFAALEFNTWAAKVASTLQCCLLDNDPVIADIAYTTLQTAVERLTEAKISNLSIKEDPCKVPRWKRILALVAVGALAISLLSLSEFLTLIVDLINQAITQQLLPFMTHLPTHSLIALAVILSILIPSLVALARYVWKHYKK